MMRFATTNGSISIKQGGFNPSVFLKSQLNQLEEKRKVQTNAIEKDTTSAIGTGGKPPEDDPENDKDDKEEPKVEKLDHQDLRVNKNHMDQEMSDEAKDYYEKDATFKKLLGYDNSISPKSTN